MKCSKTNTNIKGKTKRNFKKKKIKRPKKSVERKCSRTAKLQAKE